jgi:hypothetical protein
MLVILPVKLLVNKAVGVPIFEVILEAVFSNRFKSRSTFERLKVLVILLVICLSKMVAVSGKK